ncbi:thioredoxin family protein [Lentibacillus saliphilus]|uniref:thioredoxin family protein n=1 Tax=Lentibacillus saliphilus TaxID=2737028 RepID=UPI001C2FC735|nr:thioredoxin family protein [Lentibacillus saliphilus]
MTIKVLGPGCAKCKQLEKNVQVAVKELNQDITVEKVTDFQEIAQYGVMSTPALVVNEEVKVTGKVLKPDEIKQLLV